MFAKRFPAQLLLRIAALTGCTDGDLPPGSHIERERVLGARVEVDGDPQRATPAPGERATVTWIVESPVDTAPVEFALGACVGSLADCTPLATATGTSTSPLLTFDTPATVDGTEALWFGGTIAGSHVMASVPIAFDGPAVANRHPSLDGAPLSLAGAPWPEVTPSPGDCASSDLPQLRAADAEVELAIAIADDQRERYAERLPDGTTRDAIETLQVSHFTTVGTLDHQFSVIEPSATDGTIRVDWLAPESDVPETGLVARIVFVVRDGRGGLAIARRAACVIP